MWPWILVAVKHTKTLLRKLRRDRELTFDVLSLKTGIDRSKLSRAERGLVSLTPDQKQKLAKFFKVDADALLSPSEAA